MPTKPKTATTKQQELNRWCIEMAAKWPTVTTFRGGAGVYSAGGGLPDQTTDADLIGRANKIRTWVMAGS